MGRLVWFCQLQVVLWYDRYHELQTMLSDQYRIDNIKKKCIKKVNYLNSWVGILRTSAPIRPDQNLSYLRPFLKSSVEHTYPLFIPRGWTMTFLSKEIRIKKNTIVQYTGKYFLLILMVWDLRCWMAMNITRKFSDARGPLKTGIMLGCAHKEVVILERKQPSHLYRPIASLSRLPACPLVPGLWLPQNDMCLFPSLFSLDSRAQMTLLEPQINNMSSKRHVRYCPPKDALLSCKLSPS